MYPKNVCTKYNYFKNTIKLKFKNSVSYWKLVYLNKNIFASQTGERAMWLIRTKGLYFIIFSKKFSTFKQQQKTHLKLKFEN